MINQDLINKITLADCMDIIKDFPDKSIDLAIVDPPYGINVNMNIGKRKNEKTKHLKKKWDNNKPSDYYFFELSRISKNQISWGANNFNLKPSSGWIVWDKILTGDVDFSECELAFTSFEKCSKIFRHRIQTNYIFEKRIHPTQKPIALYRWLLQNYAKSGQLILDTHSGSGSLAVAAYLEKFDFIAIEKDADYHRDSVNRLETVKSQGLLF
jgi:site-specific DNA-methyltransferase (adenine-specific)